MGFFDKLFNQGDENIQQLGWKILQSTDQLDPLLKSSYEKPVAIFKHSTRCGTSAMVKYQLERDWDLSEKELDFYFLDLISHRSISNLVAQTMQVTHHSPQVILIRNGKTIYDASHHMISLDEIKKVLN